MLKNFTVARAYRLSCTLIGTGKWAIDEHILTVWTNTMTVQENGFDFALSWLLPKKA